MTNLFISYGASVSDRIYLDGASITTPVKGARYSPGAGQRTIDTHGRQVITEDLAVDLAGTYRQITDFITSLARLVGALNAGALHGTARLYLCVIEPDEGGGYAWISEITAAFLTLDRTGLAQRALGQQLLTLTLTRLDCWANGTNTPTLYFPNGQAYAAQGYLLNHADAGTLHYNWGYLTAAATAGGDLPTEAYLQLGITQAAHYVGDLYVGCGWPDTDAQAASFIQTTQGESWNAGAGITKTSYASAACSDGNYATYAWAATAETQLAYIAANTTAVTYWHGRPIKPMVRLQASAAYTDLWLRIKVLTGTAVVYETEWVLYQANTMLVEFPTIFIPPEGLTQATVMNVAIYAMKTSGSSYTLAIDQVQFWPIDGGFRKLKPLAYSAVGQYLIDDGYNDQVYWADSSLSNPAPNAAGQGKRISILPGRPAVLAFANLTSGATWTIDDQLLVYVNFNLLKRSL